MSLPSHTILFFLLARGRRKKGIVDRPFARVAAASGV
jgi:hypothetical protein